MAKAKKAVAVKKKAAVKVTKQTTVKKFTFQLRYRTVFGQEIFLVGDHPLLGNAQIETAVPLQYFTDEYWQVTIPFDESACTDQPVSYYYVLRNADGIFDIEGERDRSFNPVQIKVTDIIFCDAWNYAGFIENVFYTAPFSKVLLTAQSTPIKNRQPRTITHRLRVKSPLLAPNETLCVAGSDAVLGNWDTTAPLLMSRHPHEAIFSASFDLSAAVFPLAYKYGVYDLTLKEFVRFEDGSNRTMYDGAARDRQVFINDAFTVLPNNTWKGAGIAIPVFGLRSERSFGTGSFTDLKLLVDWAKQTGIKLIQLLPVNDTTATYQNSDSYPYSAISAFALHPLYFDLDKIAAGKNKQLPRKLEEQRAALNALESLDYENVIKQKMAVIAGAYKKTKASFFTDPGYLQYFEQNKHWLVPYAAFCFLRDQYGTATFDQWPEHAQYDAAAVEALTTQHAAAAGLYYFTQYHLHLQLQEATAYAHANGVVLKGDIAIGVSRNSADAWQDPTLYHMNLQAGAPPDDFAVKGQNWGFPTYNWAQMQENGFAWWRKRFEQLRYYFDAFRIDHILGFFRIWSIPMHAVEGVMGHFVPAIPVHINEFSKRRIYFDLHRYTQPYITDDVIWQLFGNDQELIKKEFLSKESDGTYMLQPAFATQRQVEQWFVTKQQDALHAKIRQGLYYLISNVILFAAEEANGPAFHFRFHMEHTSSFHALDGYTRSQLKELYVDYFFRRQETLWRKEALQKLPLLKHATDMLACGEDLGLVPACVPQVMQQLGLLSLEIQRMPKDDSHRFFQPENAPYLSVVMPSTHDMSTIRGWWEEDTTTTQYFYNHVLNQQGTAPQQCEPWINKAIVLQHLYSPAMWSIFQLSDLLGMDETLRRNDPAAERINVPATSGHYWSYRMHLPLETLLQETVFNETLQMAIASSGR